MATLRCLLGIIAGSHQRDASAPFKTACIFDMLPVSTILRLFPTQSSELWLLWLKSGVSVPLLSFL